MAIRNNLPLQVLWQQGISAEMLNGVFFGIARVLFLANVFQEFKVECLGQRRQPDWLIENTTPTLDINPYQSYQSLDWHIWVASVCDKNMWHLNSHTLLNSLQGDPTHKTNPRYEFVVVNESLISNNDSDAHFILGKAGPDHCAIITLNDYLYLLEPNPKDTDENKKKKESLFFLVSHMITIHELAHVFGVYKNGHCLNECVMRKHEDINLYTKIQDDPFCSDCKQKLPLLFK